MEDVRLIVDIVLALGAATIGGLIAQRLGLPALIGYILAGLAIGPNTPGLVADVDPVQLLANLGVALLMFGLGVEFSLGEVIRVRRAALLGGAIQIPLTVLLGPRPGWRVAGRWVRLSCLAAPSPSLVRSSRSRRSWAGERWRARMPGWRSVSVSSRISAWRRCWHSFPSSPASVVAASASRNRC